MNRILKIFFIVLFICNSFLLIAESGIRKNESKLEKTNGQPEYTLFNINNISTWVRNNGEADVTPVGNSGFVFPKGTSKTAIFQSGFVYGGKVLGEIRVGGSTYYQGQKPGRILEDGSAEDPNLDHVRIYRVRKDYITANLNDDLKLPQFDSENEVRDQYEKDWIEWPAEYGAPFNDINNNGVYEPNIDLPGEPGADQTIWFVVNDLDNVSKQLYGSPSIGIEMQVTVWGFKSNSLYGNTMFKKYKLINKSKNDFTEMYVGQWSDVDLGDATDDYSGCDTTLNLSYTYNANKIDVTYGTKIPAVGFKFIKGSSINNGVKNLDMTSFIAFVEDPVFRDPSLEHYEYGTLSMYKIMQGRSGVSGNPFIDPTNNQQTKFCMNGDPINKRGWIDGILHPPGDRRAMMTTGPFEMAIGDTQEIICAHIVAQGINNLSSLQFLKHYSEKLNEYEKNGYFNFITSLPDAPSIKKSNFSPLSKIRITWDDNNEIINELENNNYNGYEFQGYNIYQAVLLNGEKIEDKLIARFDKKDGIINSFIDEFDFITNKEIEIEKTIGEDNGLKYSMLLEKDYSDNSEFIKGKSYEYGISYTLVKNDGGKLKHINSHINSTIIKYLEEVPGANYKDKIKVNHVAGISDTFIDISIYNPKLLNNYNYQIEFENENEIFFWKLLNKTTNEIILKNEINNYSNEYKTRDGLSFDIYKTSPELLLNGIVEVKYGNEILPEIGYDSLGAKYFGNNVWLNPNWIGGNNNRDQYFITAPNNSIRFYADNYNDYELRFSTKNDNYAVWLYDENIVSVPFELWNVGINTPNDFSDDYRMIPQIIPNDESKSKTNWGWATGKDKFLNLPISDRIYFFEPEDKTPGESGYNKFAQSCFNSGGIGSKYDFKFDTNPELKNYNTDGNIYSLGRIYIGDYDQDGKMPPPGTVIRFNVTNPITENDVFEFSTQKVNFVTIPNKIDLSQNYPNPFNPVTKIEYVVPEDGKVQITIFNILGEKLVELVNLEKEKGKYLAEFDASQYSSGVYIYQMKLNDNYSETKKMVLLK